MNTLITILTLLVGLPIAALYLLNRCIFKPRKNVQVVLKALKGGPKTASQLGSLTGLDSRTLAILLDLLEQKWSLIRREPNPVNPSPAAPDLIFITQVGEQELDPEE